MKPETIFVCPNCDNWFRGSIDDHIKKFPCNVGGHPPIEYIRISSVTELVESARSALNDLIAVEINSGEKYFDSINKLEKSLTSFEGVSDDKEE